MGFFTGIEWQIFIFPCRPAAKWRIWFLMFFEKKNRRFFARLQNNNADFWNNLKRTSKKAGDFFLLFKMINRLSLIWCLIIKPCLSSYRWRKIPLFWASYLVCLNVKNQSWWSWWSWLPQPNCDKSSKFSSVINRSWFDSNLAITSSKVCLSSLAK